MAAYGALVSLMNTIYNIQNHSRLSTSLDNSQIESLGEKLDFLLDFVENHHSHERHKEVEILESQIASVAHAAEDVIESHIVDQIEPLVARFPSFFWSLTFDYEETSPSLLLDLLMYIILSIKNHSRLSASSLEKERIESLGEKLDFLLDLIENPDSHVRNIEAEMLERQIVYEDSVVKDACQFQQDRLDSYQAESTFHPPETISSWLLQFFVVSMGHILSYPLYWTSVQSFIIDQFRESIEYTEISCNYLKGLMASEAAIVAEDVTESREAISTSDHGETSCSSMLDLKKEFNAMKIKILEVQEKISRKNVAFAGSENSFLPDMQKVVEDMDTLKERVVMVKLQRGFKDLRLTSSMLAASSKTLTTGKTSVVGFESYSVQLLDWLTAQQLDQQIIPITGMGGIGKTTLARKVYDDLLVVQHFDRTAFQTLSHLGKSTTDLDKKTLDELGVLLHKFLYGRRYLIILDDVWTIEIWNEISVYFPREENRSRIVITTRQLDVADHFGFVRLALNFLDNDKSWQLFCEKAFDQRCCPSELENIGRKIVKKCRGLPLSIAVIGGLLGKSSRSQEHWEIVEKDLSSILNTAEDNLCFNILSFSYSHLPVHLKPCFLYLGIFPEDHEIRVSRLIQLWIAKGFLNPNKDPSLEDVARSFIEDLVGRNLLLACQLSTNGEVKTCRIHDLLRGFCIKVAEKEKFFCLVREPRDIGRERRLVTHERIASPLQSTSLVRSLVSEVPCHVPTNSRLLRVLCTAYDGSQDTAFQHINLRFFECHPNPYSDYNLPLSISLLWNLQTLIIIGIGVVVGAPSEIWEMQQLRHLKFHRVYLRSPRLTDEQDRIVLQNLQTLQVAQVFKISDEVCERMPNIRKLGIFLGGPEDTLAYNCFYNVCQLTKLESLHFDCRDRGVYFSWNLRLPSSLKKLSLRKCKLKWDDLTKIGSLPHLQVLKLDGISVEGPEWNPTEGEFLRLKYLRIGPCSELVYWNADSSHFPVLENLVINGLPKLDEIPSGTGDIPTLRDIYLDDCNVCAVMSAVSVLNEQESYGNEELQVRVKFRDVKDREEMREKVELEGFQSHNFLLL